MIIGASLDAANELARTVVNEKGAAFGWHRLTLPQLAYAIAAPALAERKLVPLSRLGCGGNRNSTDNPCLPLLDRTCRRDMKRILVEV